MTATTPASRSAHWNQVYATKAATEVSWYQPRPETSLALIARAGIARADAIVDVGGGAATLVDALLDAGHSDLTVLDIAESAFAAARQRLGPLAARVRWCVADVTEWQPQQQYALWHDRAVYHFLLAEDERRRYIASLGAALVSGGTAILASFAPDGPERCSGLPVRRHSAAMLAEELGAGFTLLETLSEAHHTPAGAVQRFVWCRFRRD